MRQSGGYRAERGRRQAFCVFLSLLFIMFDAPAAPAQLQRVVVGASCSTCPWGAIADMLRRPLQAEGYALQVCYNCSQTESTRIVAAARVPPPLTPAQIARRFAPPPNAPVDFGITNAVRL